MAFRRTFIKKVFVYGMCFLSSGLGGPAFPKTLSIFRTYFSVNNISYTSIQLQVYNSMINRDKINRVKCLY